MKTTDYSHLIGSELRVGYFDQNEDFARFLPVTGMVTQQLAMEGGASDWLVLKLETPIKYHKPSHQRGHDVIHLLIRSRWEGHSIGCDQTSVFILLDTEQVVGTKNSYVDADFLHVCWGMVPPEPP
jgi:hypothetical protein